MIKLFVIENEVLIRESLVNLLNGNSNIEVVGSSESIQKAIVSIKELIFDVLLLDLQFIENFDFNMIKIFNKAFPDVKILVFSSYQIENYVIRVLRAGAKGYFLKNGSAKELIAAIQTVAKGNRYMKENLAAQMITYFCEIPDKIINRPDDLSRLSNRELQVIALIVAGKSLSIIAIELNISKKTVSTHRANIKEKLQLKSTPEIVRFALEHKLNI